MYIFHCIENIVENGRNCSTGAISPIFLNTLLAAVSRFPLPDKLLFEISKVEIMSVLYFNFLILHEKF